MGYVNKVILHGRFVKDPEVKKTQSGVSYTEFTVAWSEKYKEVETKCFLRCKAWRGQADFVGKFFKKGSETVITGKMITEEWKDKDGNQQSRTICSVEDIDFCGSKQSDAYGSTNAYSFVNVPDGIEEEMPFN